MMSFSIDERLHNLIAAAVRKRREYRDEAYLQMQTLEENRKEFEDRIRPHEALSEFAEMRRNG